MSRNTDYISIFGNFPDGYQKSVALNRPKKKTKTESQLYLDSLRNDGYTKTQRAEIFKKYTIQKLIPSDRPLCWRHYLALRGVLASTTTKEHFSEVTRNTSEFSEFCRYFGNSVSLAIRSGDPAPLLASLKDYDNKSNQFSLYGFHFPSQENCISKFNKAHPIRAIYVCNMCNGYTELAMSRKIGRRIYCADCCRKMRNCNRCDAPCENEHRVMSIAGDWLIWCEGCAGRGFMWYDGHLHENPMPLNGVGTYHSSRQYMRQIGNTIPGLCSVGFELEFAPIGFAREKRDSLSVSLLKLKEIVAGVEEDGSVRHLSGAEVVTNYGSLDVVLSGADAICAVLNGKALSHSTNCCGLHVSLGRSTIHQWTLAKFVAFWNSNRNRDFLKSFCRRWESGYCKPKIEKGKLTDQMSPTRVPEHIINCHDRRELVNTQNRNRVEIRAFRGSTNAETVKRCISLCVWLMAYCEESEDKKIRYSGFLDWCKTARRERCNDVFQPTSIVEFAESKGFIGQKSPRRIIISK